MTTSPFFIYIPVGMLYEQYKTEYFAAYIDSEAGICTGKRGVFLNKLEKNYPRLLEDIFSEES